MSGIVGQVCFNKSTPSKELLEKMLDLIEHRGRDSRECIIREGVGLANNRTHIFQKDEKLQWSLESKDKQVTMVYDGEIYNFRSLRQQLSDRGYSFHTDSDAEVVLSLYQEYGLDFVNYLNGPFAIALCDWRKRELYLVRDILGSRPLFYQKQANNLYFASEIKSLVKSGACSAQIDPYGLKDYLHIQLYVGSKTLFKDIAYVPEASYLKIDMETGKIKVVPYWKMPEGEEDISYAQAVDKLESLIIDSVKSCCQIDTSFSLATYISGGLDSSLISTIASKISTQKLDSYSSIYPNMKFKDESENSRAVAASILTNHRDVILDSQEMLEAHKHSLMYKMDMPEAGYAAPYMLMARNTRKENHAVLTGNGGDEFFAGYPKYISAEFVQQINRSYHGESTFIDTSNLQYIKGFEQQAKSIFQQAAFQDEHQMIKSLFYRSNEIWNEVDEDLQKETADYDVADAIWQIAKERNTGHLKKLMYIDQKVLLKGLLHIEDRTNLSENLYSRSPLLSKTIIEFSASLPESFYLKGGLKGLIRDVAKRHIPMQVATCKSKSGMIYPVPEFLHKYMYDYVSAEIYTMDETNLFRQPVVNFLDFGKEPIYSRKTWGLWCLATWYNSFFNAGRKECL